MKREIFLTIARALLILLFIYASFSKVFDPEQFKRDMLNQPFGHAAPWFAYLLMFAVPAAEIYISVLLFRDVTQRKGFLYSAILMGAFTIYTGIVLMHFFRYIPCSCGGVIKHLTWQQHLVLNVFYFLLGVAGFILAPKQLKTNNETLSRNRPSLG